MHTNVTMFTLICYWWNLFIKHFVNQINNEILEPLNIIIIFDTFPLSILAIKETHILSHVYNNEKI